ncbi:hypothetical protein ACFY9A_19665 [Streptomyces rubradiris]|uniref:hypothetical protein n=1 Tax=Streptomyces rubradiris TaxID=285531 RepID=UPI0036EDD2F7
MAGAWQKEYQARVRRAAQAQAQAAEREFRRPVRTDCARACLLPDGHLRLLTEDHNARDATDGGDQALITACLGEARSDEETERLWGRPVVEYLHGPARPARFLLVSDGACQPHEDTGHDLAGHLIGTPRTAGVAGPVRPPRGGAGRGRAAAAARRRAGTAVRGPRPARGGGSRLK